MPAPEQLTAYDASNPASPPGLLAQIAEHRPDLRPLVAANPATPADVLAHLARLGDVAVDAALARRPQRPGPSGTTGPSGAAPAWSQPFKAPGGVGPGGAGAYPPPAPAGFAAPGATGYGSQASAGFGMPASTGYAGAGGPTVNSYAGPMGAGGYGPGYPAGPGSWGAAPKRSRTPMIVGIVVAVMVAVTGLGFVGYGIVRSAATAASEESTYGSDEQLDYLWDACEAGDGQACDDLYWDSPSFSEYEDFGNTCGGREPDGVWSCADKYHVGASGDA